MCAEVLKDLPSWLNYLTSVDARRGPDGRPMKAKPGAIPAALGNLLGRFVLLSATYSVLATGRHTRFHYTYTPFMDAERMMEWDEATIHGKYMDWELLAHLADSWVACIVIYLYLALVIDIGGFLVLLQGVEPIAGFNNPIFGSSTPTDMWGRRWNMQMHGILKRACFLPLVKRGAPKQLAGFATFVASAIYHELQFGFAFPGYTYGQGSLFFLLQGVLCVLEALVYKAVPDAGKSVPRPIKCALTTLLMTTTSELFVGIWRHSGMFDAMGSLLITVSCTFK